MHDDKRDPFVDELLKASLKQYRGEEPRSGLEMRILAGVRSRQRAARRRGLVWAVAGCAAVLATVVLTLHFLRAPLRQRTPNATLTQPVTTPPASVSQQQPRGSGSVEAPLVRVPGKRPATSKPGIRAAKRPEQFPTPFALTEQEKLLLAYVSKVTKPESAVKTNEKDEAPITQLRIPAIEIAPLEIKPLDDSQSEKEK